jgi:prefoldin subunit 5
MQEQMARINAMAKRAQIMQQQIKQERAIQAEFQQAIEHLRHQEGEPVVQEPLF